MNQLHKEVYGKGQPVVMLHGWAMHTGVWREFAQAIAKSRQVICLDLPGHGLSSSISPYDLEGLVDAIVSELPEQACSLIGWSLGGNIALRLLEKYPHRVGSLVLIASNPCFVKIGSWPGISAQVLGEFVSNLQKNSARTLLRFMSLQLQNTQEAKASLNKVKTAMQTCEIPQSDILVNGLAILKTADQREILSQIKKPILMILGEYDTLVPADIGQCCQRLNGSIVLEIMAGAGHIPFVTDEKRMVSLVQSFLN